MANSINTASTRQHSTQNAVCAECQTDPNCVGTRRWGTKPVVNFQDRTSDLLSKYKSKDGNRLKLHLAPRVKREYRRIAKKQYSQEEKIPASMTPTAASGAVVPYVVDTNGRGKKFLILEINNCKYKPSLQPIVCEPR